MSDAANVSGGDLFRELGDVTALPAIDAAVKARAEQLAASLAAEGVTTRVLQRASGAYSVELSGEGLFEREFGSEAAPAKGQIATVIAEQTT